MSANWQAPTTPRGSSCIPALGAWDAQDPVGGVVGNPSGSSATMSRPRSCNRGMRFAMHAGEKVLEARLALGAQLAARRQAAGETQRSLAHKLPYSRSTIASVETGRQHAPLDFWQRCDQMVGANGGLVDGYHRLDTLRRDQAEHRAETEAEALATFAVSDMGWPPNLKRAVVAALHLSHESVVALSCELAPTTMAASNAATLRWLLSPVERQPQQSTGERLVGRNDVAAITAMHHSLSQLDDTHGGGAVVHMALAYLRHNITPLLHGRYSAQLGTALFAATAQLLMALAWTAYDATQHDLARRAMLQALRLSHAAGDRSFGGRVLAAMSHQALHLGALDEALDLARAATEGTRGKASHGAQAMFAATEARVHAVRGDHQACQRHISQAEQAFDRVAAGTEPPWLEFVDEGEMAGKFGRCFRDLGQTRQADTFLALSMQRHKTIYPRSRAITQLVWASTYARQGEIEEACRVGREALTAIGPIRSERTRDYLRDLQTDLVTHHRIPDVADFLQDARLLLSTPA